MVDGEAGSNNSEPSPDIKNKSRATMLNDEEMLADGGFLLKRNKEKGEWTKKLKACAHSFIVLSVVYSIIGIKKLVTPRFG